MLILVRVMVGRLTFVKTQVKSAPAFTLSAGIVSTLPDNVAKALPVLPVMALLASVQVAVLIKKPAAGVSVKVTAVPIVLTLIAVGVVGVAVLATVVVMLLGVLARFVWSKLNGPPAQIGRAH